MTSLIVVDRPELWPLSITGVEVAAARDYLTLDEFGRRRHTRVFNLCRSYRYQSTGYYVSLLGEARGHRPMPSVGTLQDLRSPAIIRIASEDLAQLIKSSLASLRSDAFTLSIYFGRNMATRYQTLCTRLFSHFQTPLLRVQFVHKANEWQIRNVRVIAAREIPESHHSFVIESAIRYFGSRQRGKRPADSRYDLAILHDQDEKDTPSNARALDRFVRAAASLGIATRFITQDDSARLAEFDALFIRATTRVNHYTYRFSQRAEAEGLVVVDAPRDIIRCSNKVYLAERLTRHRVATPKTMIVHAGNRQHIIELLKLPCILKQPDSAFSQGVHKVDTQAELNEKLDALFDISDLVVAQSFLPTDFDWRIGVLDGVPLFACRYYMARRHWQIVRRDGERIIEGNADTLAVEDAPAEVIRIALRATRLIGRGLYGVDIKQSRNRCYVIEINDNPNIDAGIEDAVLKGALYDRVMRYFLDSIEKRKAARTT
ncbi:MAG: ribosomal protein S6 modification protein [marine bacterium B5-7]|nr:MAG: ribosomal protein S6 modification protein [marine bacterium B5-7]